jgi:phage I-like protein
MPHPAAAPFAETALCRALPLELGAGGLPEWLLLAPLGESRGRDGRAFRLDDPAAVIAAMAADGADIPLDWEHGTHLRAPQGDPAPAAGWVVELQSRPDGLWGRVEWTPAGAEAVRSRSYRYYSPAYRLAGEGRAVVGIPSVGLTNKPNLHLPALNRDGANPEDSTMSLSPAIASALALADSATEADALSAIEALKTHRDTAMNRAQTPDLSLYVPRADFDAALNRGAAAESALRTAQQAELDREITALIEQGLQQARITPATVEYHRAQAQGEGGLARLKAYLAVAPQVLGDPAPKGAPPEGTPELNRQAAAIAAAFGNTPEILAQYGVAR